MSRPERGCLRVPVALEAKSLATIQRRLASFLAECGCGAELRFRVELVVEETMMNVIRHARPLGATAAELSARCTPGSAAIAIEDDGPAFDPLAAPLRPLTGALTGSHEGGFGLHLIRRNADTARYARTPVGRNRLELGFQLREPGDPPA